VHIIAKMAAMLGGWSLPDNLGHPDVCVAVIDGPVDLTHPCFVGAELTTIGGEGQPPTAHGTHTASLIFGQPGTSVVGVAPRCRGLLIAGFRPLAPHGQLGCSQSELAHAITLALEQGAHVINIGGGQIPAGEAPDPELVAAVQRCERQRVLIVAAAGNDGCACMHVPAALDSVLAVGAIDASGEAMDWSNWSESAGTGRGHTSAPDGGVMAPGVEIVGAVVGGGVESLDGTSCATALVSGLAGLLLGIQRTLGSRADPLAVRQAIVDSTEHSIVHVHAAAELVNGTNNFEIRNSSETDQDRDRDRDRAMPNVDSNHENHSTPSPATGAHDHVVSSAHDHVAPCSGEVSRPWTGACHCGGSQLVYFIGELSFNFGRVTRLDSFAQSMGPGKSPYDPGDVLKHITKNPWAAASVIWTIGFDSIPMYAVAPLSFEEAGYLRLRQLLEKQLAGEVARIAVPGLIAGMVDLLCGGRVPVIVPDLRGVTSWERSHLHAEAVTKLESVNFLSRVFYELRSPGLTHDDRAINFAATEALTTHAIFKTAQDESLVLEKISVDDSPVCRPGSICRDVLITFFNPARRFEQARKVFRLTVDVADTVPARIGEVRSWYVY
jgi:hypothetical protein